MAVTRKSSGLNALCQPDATCITLRPATKRPRRIGRAFASIEAAIAQFTRVQVWPPQNMPPKAQPCTRRVSVPFMAIVES